MIVIMKKKTPGDDGDDCGDGEEQECWPGRWKRR